MSSVAGFLLLDNVAGEVPATARIVVLGVPVDGGAARSGCEAAPDTLRRVSSTLEPLSLARGADLGNISPESDWRHALERFVRQSSDGPAIPVIIGGGAEVAEVALSAWPEVPVIVASDRLRGGLTGRDVLWLGLNGPQPAAAWDAAIGAGQRTLSARDIDDGQQPEWPDRAVLWIDAGVFDLGHAAGAADVNPGGATPEAIVRLVDQWGGTPAGVIITGATPQRDPRGVTELALATVVKRVIQHV